MKGINALLIGMLCSAIMCSCNQSSKERLHEQCVEIYKNERIEEAKGRMELTKQEAEICEYILNIKENEEFIKAVAFLEDQTEESLQWNAEFDKLEKEMDIKAEQAENSASEMEILVGQRAVSLGLAEASVY